MYTFFYAKWEEAMTLKSFLWHTSYGYPVFGFDLQPSELKWGIGSTNSANIRHCPILFCDLKWIQSGKNLKYRVISICIAAVSFRKNKSNNHLSISAGGGVGALSSLFPTPICLTFPFSLFHSLLLMMFPRWIRKLRQTFVLYDAIKSFHNINLIEVFY